MGYCACCSDVCATFIWRAQIPAGLDDSIPPYTSFFEDEYVWVIKSCSVTCFVKCLDTLWGELCALLFWLSSWVMLVTRGVEACVGLLLVGGCYWTRNCRTLLSIASLFLAEIREYSTKFFLQFTGGFYWTGSSDKKENLPRTSHVWRIMVGVFWWLC